MSLMIDLVKPDGGAARRPYGRMLTGAALVIVLAVFPLVMSPFANLQVTLTLVYAVAILGLDILVGWTGQVSLGQSAFFGIGAYGVAVCADRGWPVWAGLLFGVVLAGVVGCLVAVPAARLRGYALGMITLTLPVVAVPLAKRLEVVTGGAQGLNVTIAEAPEWTGLAADQWHYYVVAAGAALVFALAAALRRSHFGRAFDAVRVDEALATAQGVHVTRYKVLAFTLSAVYGGFAGVLYVVAVQFISPETLILTLSISLLAGLAIGGLRSLLGCVLGAAFYVVVPNVTGEVSAGQSYLLYGVCLLAVMLLMPRGVAPALDRVVRNVAGRRGRAVAPGD
ncbi:branched-chain amino acid ABC transporter permease [Planotetraspora thailandica]|uniref:Branched-chain amino acid ABC transporter permease n=1 Tax=Planotetraspora thailandica TaxID=487172 RepID=A0A8J3Y0P7_9ACTN|nr:branched-chain amino acid ABC transporter permease [Planotetraspora thailandica]GII58702.1 branched-chain amino acid ABC transporter permease [Planotetraspora thailandica]